jgi:hypothetical protein
MKRTKKAAPTVDVSMTMAYTVAEGLAAVAVRQWTIDTSTSEERDNDLSTVYDALIQYGHRRVDPMLQLQAAITQYITERGAQIDASDHATALLTEAMRAGYLYGLAIGRAMGKAGSR